MLTTHPDLLVENGYRDDDLKHQQFNTCTNRTGHQYIRVLKSFTSAAFRNTSPRESEFRSAPLVRKFVLRFYLPKEPISFKPIDLDKVDIKGKDFWEKTELPLNKDGGIKHIVIMINGLDEYQRDNLIFYDTMASHFAQQGIASVLLSTPYHMHRVARNTRSKELRPGDGPFLKPSRYFELPLDFFIHFKQTVLDIEKLTRKIKQKTTAKNDYDFYSNNFSPDVKVTILGYSLGGLISLAAFVRGSKQKDKSKISKKPLIDNSILYNTAPHLNKASTDERFGKGQEFWEKFTEPKTFGEVRNDNPNNDELADLFFRLYGGQSPETLISIRKVIKDNSEKFLLIMSGDDNIVDITSWDEYFSYQSGPRKKTTINQYIVAGAGHSPMNEAQGAESLPKVLDIITSHILTNKLSHWQRPDILNLARPLVQSTDYYNQFVKKKILAEKEKKSNVIVDFSEFEEFNRQKMDAVLNDFGEDRQKFLAIYHLSKIYYPKFKDLMNSLWALDKRNPRNKKKKSK